MMLNDRVYRVFRQKIGCSDWRFVCHSIRGEYRDIESFAQAISGDYLSSTNRPSIRIENDREIGAGYSYYNPHDKKRINNFPIETDDLVRTADIVFSSIASRSP